MESFLFKRFYEYFLNLKLNSCSFKRLTLKRKMKKKLIVLDLDATLISAQSCSTFNEKKEAKKKSKFKFFKMDNYYIVFARPNLQIFLDYIFKNFRVAVWTAASQLYALSVIENFILSSPGRRLDFVMFDYHNEHSISNGKGTKDLSLLKSFYGLDFNDVIILDDYSEVCKTNPVNSIKAKFFDYKKRNSQKDDFLLRVISKFEHYLQN